MWLLSCYCHSVHVYRMLFIQPRKIENPTVWTFTDVISIKNSVGIKAKNFGWINKEEKTESQPCWKNGFSTTAYLPLFMFRIQGVWLNEFQ